jgi:RNA polymerase sigma factor (sigma-70 family)
MRAHPFDAFKDDTTKRLEVGAKRGKRTVKYQQTNVIDVGKDCGEGSPYWNWIHENQERVGVGEHQEIMEPFLANPDRLADSFSPFEQESGKISVGDLSLRLPKMQQRVFDLYIQEGKGENDIAKILQISVGTVRNYLARIRKKLRKVV